MNHSATNTPVRAQVERWLDTVVIGLNLCPFAAHPRTAGRVQIQVSSAADPQAVLEVLHRQIASLLGSDAAETTLLVLPQALPDFADYNDFLDLADALLREFHWENDVQIASFHPHYQFAGTRRDDAENLTNRAPYPILHILRADSVDAAVEHHPDTAQIPADNIARMEALTPAERTALFPWLGYTT